MGVHAIVLSFCTCIRQSEVLQVVEDPKPHPRQLVTDSSIAVVLVQFFLGVGS